MSYDLLVKIQQMLSLAKMVDTEEAMMKAFAALEKARDYDDENGNDDDVENQEGFRVFDPDQEESEDDEPKQDYDEYAPDEDEEAHQSEEPETKNPQGPSISTTPEDQGEAKQNAKFPQPTKDDIVKLREYSRPWEQNARDTARLTAEAKTNPELHHQGHLIEARNKSHGDKNAEYDKYTKTPEYQNADPISQMEMDSKFHEDYNKKNPEYLKNAVNTINAAHKQGAKAHDIHAIDKYEQNQHIRRGGAQAEDPMKMEAAMQHAGGQKGEEGTTGSVVQDKAAAFAAKNKDFLDKYYKEYDKKHVKPKSVEDMSEYNEPAKKDLARILGDNPALKDPAKKAHLDQFFKQYYPLIGMNAARTMSKLGLDAKKSDLDLGSMHEAGMHGLMQAINDYDHEHPSKASFATHASNKIRGLQQTALRAQDQIPQELRAAAKKDQHESSRVMKPQAPATVEEPTKPAAPLVAPAKPKTIIRKPGQLPATTHSKVNDITDRFKRINTHRSAMNVNPNDHEEGEE